MHLTAPTERMTMPPPPSWPFPEPHPLLPTCCLPPKSAPVWNDIEHKEDINDDDENHHDKDDVKEEGTKNPALDNQQPAAVPGQRSPRQFANTYTLPELRISYNLPAASPTLTTLAWATIYLACRREWGYNYNAPRLAPNANEAKPITFIFNQAQFTGLLQGSQNTWDETLSFPPGSSIPCMANGLVDLLRNSEVYRREELPILMQQTLVVASNAIRVSATRQLQRTNGRLLHRTPNWQSCNSGVSRGWHILLPGTSASRLGLMSPTSAPPTAVHMVTVTGSQKVETRS